MAKLGDAITIELDIDELTLGQVEFLCDYSGLELEEVIVAFQNDLLPLKLIIATIALTAKGGDKKAGLKYARSLKMSQLLDSDEE